MAKSTASPRTPKQWHVHTTEARSMITFLDIPDAGR